MSLRDQLTSMLEQVEGFLVEADGGVIGHAGLRHLHHLFFQNHGIAVERGLGILGADRLEARRGRRAIDRAAKVSGLGAGRRAGWSLSRRGRDLFWPALPWGSLQGRSGCT